MAYAPASDRLASIIADGRGVSDRDSFIALKNECQRWKRDDYDAHQICLRHYYEGHFLDHLRAAARQRFRFTGDRMQLIANNWAFLTAVNGAAVYDYPTERHLARDGEAIDPAAEGDAAPTPEDVQRAEDFATMLREAHLDLALAEAERRNVLAKTVFLKVYSDSLTAIARGKPTEPATKVELFWPSDVLVLPHPRCPTSLATALCVMLRVSGEDGVQGGSTTWEVWTRSFVEDEAGQVTSFDPWRAELVTETQKTVRQGMREVTETKIEITPIVWKGKDGAVSETYPLPTLPIVEWHDGIASGSPFLDVDRISVPNFDAMNLAMMAEQFAVDFNSATPVIRKSEDITNGTIALGPGVMTRIPITDSIEAVQVSANFAGIRGASQALVDSHALTRRQAPSGYNAESAGTPSTGTALKIKNEPQAKARLEAVARAVEFESRLLAVMVEVHDFWRGTSIADDGVTYVMEPHDPPEYEERSVTQKRAIDAKDAGLIDDVTAVVASGWARTAEDARAQLAKIKGVGADNPMRAALNDAANAAMADAKQPTDPTAPPAATDGTGAALDAGAAVQDTALNGAQVQALLQIVQAVTAGMLPKQTAQAVIAAAFPSMSTAQVASIMSPVVEGSAAPEPAPAPPPPA